MPSHPMTIPSMSQSTIMKLCPVLVLVYALTIVQGVSIDELIVNAANTTQEFEFFYDDNGGMLKVEYDILMSTEEYNAMQIANGEPEEGRKKRSAGMKVRPYYSGRWENNIVYYQYISSFSGDDIREIDAAIRHWERYTCLDFRQSTSAENRIQFQNGGGCYSRVGMSGGTQPIGLAPGCRRKPVVIHEIGHAIGLFHEQTRPDRDQHVSIIRRNIAPDMFYNFKKNTWETVLNMGISYDYMSIMHYGKRSFSVNGQDTIRTTDPAYQDLIGEAWVLSFRDVKSVNIMYNCKRHTPGCTLTDADCPGVGFVGKDCTCWCQGDMNNREDADPIRPCSPNPTRRPVTSRPVTARPVTARPVTARPVTSRPVTSRPATPRPSECQDQHRSCSYWTSVGECSRNPGYMHSFCKRSCNRCNGGGGGENCEDTHHACAKWRRIGYCNRRYQDIVRPRCRKSCGLCTSSSSSSSSAGARRPNGNCRDSNSMCPGWASRGECNRNPAYMLTSCRFSCGRCNAASPAAGSRCRDRNSLCGYWAGRGECGRNPGFMRLNCRASCRLRC